MHIIVTHTSPVPITAVVKEEGRSPEWTVFRNKMIKAHPFCACCGGTEHLQLHHVWPFSWPGGKEKELDPENVIVLCEKPSHNCHLTEGHLGDFRSRNPDIKVEAPLRLHKIQNRPYPPKEN